MCVIGIHLTSFFYMELHLDLVLSMVLQSRANAAFERPSTGNHFGLPLSTVCVIGIHLCHLTSFFNMELHLDLVLSMVLQSR